MERSARRAIIRAPWRRPMRSMRCAATAIQAVARGRAARRARRQRQQGDRAQQRRPAVGAEPGVSHVGALIIQGAWLEQRRARAARRAVASASAASGVERQRRAAATMQRAWGRAADRRIFTFYASTVRAAGALPEGFLSSAAGGRGARALGSALLPSGVAGLAAGVPATLELRLGVGAAPWPPEILFRFRAARSIKVVQVGLPPGRTSPGRGGGDGWRPLPRRGSETRAHGPWDARILAGDSRPGVQDIPATPTPARRGKLAPMRRFTVARARALEA